MATKPNETYKWGENATHEQVAAYSDTGWPADNIPPKRTQFNWYQNLVGRWLGWVEDAVDNIVETVLDAWFVEVPGISGVPNKTGIYKQEARPIFYLVYDNQMIGVGFAIPLLESDYAYLANYYTWSGSQWESVGSFASENEREFILQESASNYVTPKGLVDYFNVTGASYYASQYQVPHQTGVYLIRSTPPQTTHYGVSIVVGDNQAYIPYDSSVNGGAYKWEGGQWIQQ